MSELHAFIGLDPTDREEWVFAFCGRRRTNPPIGPSFPALKKDQSPEEWLMWQFQMAGETVALRDRLRQTVVAVAGRAGRMSPSAERNQALGALLEVAQQFGFTELADDLIDWARKDWLDEGHVYELGGADVPLRRTVWELLISWKKLDLVGPQLRRDLVRLVESDEPGTAQLCFVALGERDPGAAIEMIPYTLPLWHQTYWLSTVRKFLESIGPFELLRDTYKAAWSACLGPCFFDAVLVDRYLRDPRLAVAFDSPRPNRFYNLLNEIGIEVKQGTTTVLLVNSKGGRLVVDVRQYVQPIAQSMRMPSQGSSLFQELAV